MTKPLVPLWAQFAVGTFVVFLVFVISVRTLFSVSEWHTPDSNFYDNAADALMHSQITLFQGDIPTLVFFWELGCEDCKDSLEALEATAPNINLIGVHLKTDPSSKSKARQWWYQHGRKTAPLYFDDSSMLENTFSIRQLPANFLYFPQKKTIRLHLGSLSDANPNIPELMKQLE